MSTSTHYNALILGSGQAGTPLATHIKSLGQSVCLIERSHIAGCCVNEGCTPTKTMVASGRIAYLARRMGEYGVSAGSGKVEVDMQKVRQRKRDIVTSFRGGSEKRLKNAGVDVLMGEARFVGEREIEVRGSGEENRVQRVSADRIFVNAGCRPARPNVPGLDDVDQDRVLDSTSIQELGEVPEHLVVVGGGVIGLEFGQLFRKFGAQVTILVRGPKLLSKRDDPELANCMQNILEEDGIKIQLDTQVSHISKTNDENLPVEITTTGIDKQQNTLKASHILLATGRTPNTDSLNLSAANITTTPTGFIPISPTLETNIKEIYAMGDVKGGPAFTHISYDDFRIIRDNLYSLNSPKTLRTITSRTPIIPSVTYIDPQFAHIGPKLGDLDPNKTYVTYSMPASWIARGLETDETRGMLKAVVDKESGEIVSFSAICAEGGEVGSVVQMAMVGGLRWTDLRDGIFAHPGWAESLNNLWGGQRREIRGGET